MALYGGSITVDPLTSSKKMSIPVGEPTVTGVWLRFPRGCAGLVGIRILDRSLQIAPLPAPNWIALDGESIRWTENRKLQGSPYEITIEAYNQDDTYPHTVAVFLELNNENYWDGRRVY